MTERLGPMGTSIVDLGRLEKISLRHAWPDEAQNFTPWLAEDTNLALLGDTLGIQLEVEAVEKQVGPFCADILAKEMGSERWTSEVRGDGAGYDIRSFALDGKERLIEVKTTNGPAKTSFFLSENERAFSDERPEAFNLFRLYSFAEKPSAFELRPPLSDRLALNPVSHRANLI